ncbi:hypothetical protein [Halopseudomonas sp.]|uniref:hypothetical protein n=1 Tax=Halopseudomonas sp. TaxID=2901191 RepID=UPI00311EE23A
MRADWDERPRRRRRADESAGRLIRWGFWGVAAVLVLYASQPELVERLSERFYAGAPIQQQAASPAPALTPPQPVEPVSEHQSPITEADLAAARAIALGQTGSSSGGRQTSFSDDNYVPRRDVNVMESRHVREYAQAQPSRPAPSRPRGLNGSGTVTVTWEDARRRVSRWPTSYTYRNSIIDTASFCSNYRRGSIEYRTCRKGAKAWLGQRCGNGNRVGDERQRMYCHAHSGFGQ